MTLQAETEIEPAERHSVVASRSRERELVRELVDGVFRGDPDRVRSVIDKTILSSDTLIQAVSQLLDAPRWITDEMWYRGELSVADQHRMLRPLEVMVAEAKRPRPARRHTLGRCILVATDEVAGDVDRSLLEEDGWSVNQCALGELIEVVQSMRPARALVIVVGSDEPAPRELRSVITSLHRLGATVLVAAPGRWVQGGGWHQLGADATASDARMMVLLARKLHSSALSFSISEVAGTIGVTAHTIRAWERRYNLPLPARDRNGQRQYGPEDVELLLRVSHAVTVYGHSLKLATLEAQGLPTVEANDLTQSLLGTVVESADSDDEQPWLGIADAIPVPLLLIDSNGVIVDCNIAVAKLLETMREDLRGTPLTDHVIAYDRAKAVRLYKPNLKARDRWELRLKGRTGEQILAAFDSRLVSVGGAHLLGLMGKPAGERPDGEATSAAGEPGERRTTRASAREAAWR